MSSAPPTSHHARVIFPRFIDISAATTSRYRRLDMFSLKKAHGEAELAEKH
jgi:hypothetical protein